MMEVFIILATFLPLALAYNVTEQKEFEEFVPKYRNCIGSTLSELTNITLDTLGRIYVKPNDGCHFSEEFLSESKKHVDCLLKYEELLGVDLLGEPDDESKEHQAEGWTESSDGLRGLSELGYEGIVLFRYPGYDVHDESSPPSPTPSPCHNEMEVLGVVQSQSNNEIAFHEVNWQRSTEHLRSLAQGYERLILQGNHKLNDDAH